LITDALMASKMNRSTLTSDASALVLAKRDYPIPNIPGHR
jgi:hypothetical protein